MARQLCFLTLERPEGFVIDEDHALPTLEQRGYRVESVPWTRGEDWSRFDAVVVRSTWDYQDAPGRFLEVLADIDAATRLWNPRALCEWNVDKRYLIELEAKGVPVVPTIWQPGLEDLAPLLSALDTDELVLKPAVSANADNTFRAPQAELPEGARAALADRVVLAQPFLRTITSEGEHSLFYFDGALSHGVNKRPKPADFRVQEEHGGIITPLVLDDEVRAAGARVMQALPMDSLYARVDLVRHAGALVVIEVELIEPALYFRMHEAAPANFCDALDAWFTR